jgi:hypothetical protein
VNRYDDIDCAVISVLRLGKSLVFSYLDVAAAYRKVCEPALDIAHSYAADLIAMLWWDGLVTIDNVVHNYGISFSAQEDIEGLQITRALPPLAWPQPNLTIRELEEAFAWYAPKLPEPEPAQGADQGNAVRFTSLSRYEPSPPRTPKP